MYENDEATRRVWLDLGKQVIYVEGGRVTEIENVSHEPRVMTVNLSVFRGHPSVSRGVARGVHELRRASGTPDFGQVRVFAPHPPRVRPVTAKNTVVRVVLVL